MLALSIRQPFAELILRGIKTVEYRSRRTSIVGERFWIYSCQSAFGVRGYPLAGAALGKKDKTVWSTDLSVPREAPWMLELAVAMKLFSADEMSALPRGVIVGSGVIDDVVARADGMFEWRLTDVQRVEEFRKPEKHPQPVWFRPF